MNERNKARLLPLACLAFALAAPQLLEAQFGVLGRRITEGAKKAAGVETDDASKPETSLGCDRAMMLDAESLLKWPFR